MSYKIVIPSYRRAKTCFDKTYQLLRALNVPDDLIFVFTTPEEYYIYREQFHDTKVVIQAGVKGLVQQRTFICKMFPGQNLLFMDDDISSFVALHEYDFDTIVREAFMEAAEKGLRLWGVYPVANKYFMTETVSFDLKYIVGCCYGLRNKHPEHEYFYDDKEDYYRSCIYYKQDGGVMRLNWIAPNTKYYTEPGGMQERRTKESNALATTLMVRLFPTYATLVDKGEWLNLRLRDRTQDGMALRPSILR